jgi:TonB family protein
MKKIKQCSVLLACGALASVALGAAVESVKIEPTFIPSFSPVLLGRGITQGKVALAIDVSAEGKVTDWLVLGYTDREFVDYFIEALKGWEITAARVDGKPVGAQVELVGSVTAQGVVLSRTGTEMMEDHVRRIMGNPIKYQRAAGHDLDRGLVRVSLVTPKYAELAAKDGVHGRVQVFFYVDEHGAVRLPSVEAGAHPYLAAEAVAAVREWKFEPPTSRGRPVLVAASQVFDFSGGK